MRFNHFPINKNEQTPLSLKSAQRIIAGITK